MRVGLGYDIHRTKEGDHVWLGGLRIPAPFSLVGHSDADVLLHAITDAIFGALGDYDIGYHFPPSDEKNRGRKSAEFLQFAIARMKSAAYKIGNIDCNIICEMPRITPVLVPHRDEFSETVGYRIESPRKKVLFIPDIDKWEKWSRNIVQEVRSVDHALLDATFFRDGELLGRSMQEVPHPFVVETMQRFSATPATEKSKVTFIHFNHTNPLIWQNKARNEVLGAGFSIAEEGMVIGL